MTKQHDEARVPAHIATNDVGVNNTAIATTNRTKVLLVQQLFAHYRIPLFRTLAARPSIELTVVHGTSPGYAKGEFGLDNVQENMPFRVVRGPIPAVGYGTKALLWHKPAVDLLRHESFDVVLHNFATRWASLGTIRRMQQRRGGKFILWGIGFSQTSTPLLNLLRRRIVHGADATLLYSERDRQKYINMGLPKRKLFVARNSVDISAIDGAIEYWSEGRLKAFRSEHDLMQGPMLLSVGRLARQKRIDLLLHAAALLKSSVSGLSVVIVGDGPELSPLRSLSKRLGLDKHVFFAGSVVDEMAVAPWFGAADIVIAPAQIGLLAHHSHAYGKPLVFSDDPKHHGPEVEIAIPNETAVAYRSGDVEALTRAIIRLLSDSKERTRMGERASERVRHEFGLNNMVAEILASIDSTLGKSVTRTCT